MRTKLQDRGKSANKTNRKEKKRKKWITHLLEKDKRLKSIFVNGFVSFLNW